MGAILLSILATALLLVFITGCGLAVFLNSHMAKAMPHPAFGFGVAAFFGLAGFLTLFRGIDLLLSNARLSLHGTLFLMLGAAVFFGWRLLGGQRREAARAWLKSIRWQGLLFFALLLLFVAYTGMNLPRSIPVEDLHPYYSVGTLHSPRYVSIARYIVQNNLIPVIGQNYGQSILVAVVELLLPGGPYLVLYLFLVFTKTMLVVFTYGFCRAFLSLSGRWSILCTALAVCGGTALALGNVLVVDSGSPMFNNTYTDSQFSVATFYIAVAALVLAWQSRKGYAFTAALLVAFGVSWNFTAAQNNLFLLMLMGAAFLIAKGFRKPLAALGAALAGGTLAGIPMGGMLTPAGWVTTDLPGQMQVRNSRVVLHEFSFPAFVATDKGNQQLVRYLEPVAYNPVLNFMYHQMALVCVFFPLAGAALFIGLAWRRCITDKNQLAFGFISLFSFAAALVLVCFVSVGSVDYWWEMTRFIMKDYYAMMLLLGVCLHAFARRYAGSKVGGSLAARRGWKARLSWPSLIAVCVAAFSLAGPMYSMLAGRGRWSPEGLLVFLDNIRRLYHFDYFP